MASTARLGLKLAMVWLLSLAHLGRNGLYSPFGIETAQVGLNLTIGGLVGMASTARLGLKPPFLSSLVVYRTCRNGLYSPFGIETSHPPGCPR